MRVLEKAFDLPFYHRFIFVPKNTSFYASYVIQLSGSIKSVKRAYQIAVELFKEHYPEIEVLCAVFYGHASDAEEQYANFYTVKKFKRRFKL